MNKNLFEEQQLDATHSIFIGQLPEDFLASLPSFEALWDLHPKEYHLVKILGKEIPTPRWQQAYGFDYVYTGSKQNSLPITTSLKPFQNWCQAQIHPQMNSLLLNWYEGEKKHYIGPHRDSPLGLLVGTPIVTISMGEERIFRFRPWRGKGYQDFVVKNGTVVIIPWDTNKAWTHEVPHFVRFKNRRISVTLRVYEQ
ncbi:alpha-ketoglutarate-dependent dioxygenase AlkB [Aureispira anguillae]|uniref:Alpha-ketoglutarate-dependent dioxygenase AlkB n=1 Tax=Aureispira anguillae TaxID=2864201 RepID=A0A916DUE4_9BACT|nr:alpha-ketoglutarate-dependent dioxygenase AlkB [Aureispira anguillae]BDS12176.1 alpha-ketoglutarate-dependent dioxygenase AlkB [Aureispira anguillae]